MANKKLKVAVIGCGAVSQRRHLPEYAARPDVELVAVVDINKARAAEVAEQFKVPQYFTDYKKALAMKPDAVSVCTPTALHAPYSIAALRAGAHVLVEKPMCASVAQAKAMIAAAKAARRQIMVGHNQRLHVSHVRAKEFYRSGALGKCLAFSTTFAHGGPEIWSVDGLNCHFFRGREAIWGAMADLGVHKLDLMRWFLDDDFVQAAAMCGTLQKKKCDVDDTAFAVLRTRSGVLGQMFAGWIHTTGCDNSTILYCQKGVLRLEADPQFTIVAELATGERRMFQTRGIQTNAAGGQHASGVIDAFVDAIRSGKPNPIPAADVINSVAAVVACVQSNKTGRIVNVAKY
jgi:predicted dehydrogenase